MSAALTTTTEIAGFWASCCPTFPEGLIKTKESLAVDHVEDITNYALFAGKAGETGHGKVLFSLPDELQAPLTFRFAIKQAGEVVKYLVVK